jgi:glycogen debranching enzyme
MHNSERLVESAQAVLDENWVGHSTVPSLELYPHQWSWDSGFIAIGRSWTEQPRAQQELERLFAGQWANGMLPHIVFNPNVPSEAYFPGPDFWQSDRAHAAPAGLATSGITQPPLHARAALEVYRQAPDRGQALAFLRRLYPKLVAQHRYLSTRRDVAGEGLAAIVHPWESGLDNSPAWDAELQQLQIPPAALPGYRRRDLAHADPRDRPSDLAYERFVYLAMSYRDSGYEDSAILANSPFVVEDPMFNAIFLDSLHAIAEIARLIGHDPSPHRATATRVHQALLDRLWDPRAGRFYPRDPRGGRRGAEDTIVSFMPLLDPDLPPVIVKAIVAQLSSPDFRPLGTANHYLLPSLSLRDPAFDTHRYWRGPIWINTDWLVWQGLRRHGQAALAGELRDSIVGLVRRSGFREYFDPFGGQGRGSHNFSWTAALLIDCLHRPA